jgi:hypothetical protein
MKTPKVTSKKEKRYLRYDLNHDEIFAAGKEQADVHGELVRTEADKKRITSEFTAKVEGLKARLGILADKISTGYEHRDLTCTVYFDMPQPNKKTIIRDDNGETVAVEEMTGFDMQRDFFAEQESLPS